MTCSHCGLVIKKELMEPHVRGHEFQLVKSKRTGLFHYRRLHDNRRPATVDEKIEMVDYVRRMGFISYAEPYERPLIDRRTIQAEAA